MKTIAVCMAGMISLTCFGAQKAPPPPPAADIGQHLAQEEQEIAREIQKNALKLADEARRKTESVVQAQKDALKEATQALNDIKTERKLQFEHTDDLEFNAPDVGWGKVAPVFAYARSGAQSLIVRTGDLDPEAAANITEDFTVMSRILTKAVESEGGRVSRDSAMGIVLSALPGTKRPQSMYLEGYGALFLLNVNMPLVRPTTQEDAEDEEKDVDSMWEQTRREVFGQRRPRVQIHASPKVAFSEERVNDVKQAVIEALKNATNLRNIKPEESITVVLQGSRVGASEVQIRRSVKGPKDVKSEIVNLVHEGDGAVRESTMTFQVKKSDVDAFAKKDIDLAEFTKRVTVSAY